MKISPLRIKIRRGLVFLLMVGMIPVITNCRPVLPVDTSPLGNPAQADATYVGETTCIGCHQVENSHWSHTLHARVFRLNPQDELQARSCEACHGPGSKHITEPTNKSKIMAFTRTSGSSILQQNAMCLQCHRGRERIYWPGSTHQVHDLGCSDCHNPMAQFSRNGLLKKESISLTCFTCHQQQRVQFRKRSHMPLLEGKISCVDCHNPHGSNTTPLLKADTVNQLCYQCHPEKRGPFIWEHAPVRENCLNCHLPHGSNHEKLLSVARPFLCEQCHTNRGHPNDLLTMANMPSGLRPDGRLMNRSCQNCHAQIHGSNHPSGVRFHR
ncbi:cytochrome C family protein [Nitrosococcus halophilus Nc 4]|uniref:Cytochrome C family protein n=2 Tax=Nitrosococcus halophilus TaxID=133539 RepID=D5BZQ9_NITHN|nr:cytochrome C family protein [Nitrosococcus halophilus Nc 4]